MTRTLLLLCCLAVLAPGCAGPRAEPPPNWPPIRERWWESLRPGEETIYEIEGKGPRMLQIMRIEAVAGSEVTWTGQTVTDEKSRIDLEPPKKATFDAEDEPERSGAIPPRGTNVELIGEETLVTAGRKWACTVLEVNLLGKRYRIWHSPDLPPCYHGGAVKYQHWEDGAEVALTLIHWTRPAPK